MTGDILAAAALVAPGAVLGCISLVGHHHARRRDEAEAAIVATYQPDPPTPEPPPKGRIKGPRQTAPARLATVIGFPTHRRTAA